MLLLLTWLLATSEVLYHPPPLASTGQVAVSENKMDKLIETLKRHEGVKSHAYKDSLGILHIGCGRNIENSKEHRGIGLSDEEIDFMLSNDIARTIQELSKEYRWCQELDEGARRDAIINMHFNLGRYRFAKFVKAIGHMESGNYDAAAAEFLDSRWAKQVKGRSLEVTDMIKTNTYV